MQVKRDKKTMVAFAALAVLVVALLAVAGVFAAKYYELRENPGQVGDAQREELVNKVSKLYNLPKDEEPIVGEVKDVKKLKDQAFFKSAKNGDDILIYKEARLAIIYRSTANKLINVGPIAIDAGQGSSSSSSKDSQPNNNEKPAGDDAENTPETTTPPVREENAQ